MEIFTRTHVLLGGEMSWCKISSLNASVDVLGRSVTSCNEENYSGVARASSSGWEVGYFLKQALSKERYLFLCRIMADVESWAETQS